MCVSLTQCRQEVKEIVACDAQLINQRLNFHYLVRDLPNDVVINLAKAPTAEGALGRNRSGYFHVRFQMDMVSLTTYAVKFQSEEALEQFVRAVEYSFRYQLDAGDFELIVPVSLQSLAPPTAGDLCSGVAFFASALGSSLVLLQQSSWYAGLKSGPLHNRIMMLREPIRKMLSYLEANKQLLQDYDQQAPNRLLFDAVAFYSLGVYLNDALAQTTARDFINRALQKQDGSGYFIEGDGFDSSYNGVALKLGLTLLGIAPATDPVYSKLQQSLSCCAQWQASRVLNSGEISAEGNTRVYPGGESFLGDEKSIAWVDTLLSFYYVKSLSQQSVYLDLANRIRSYYQ